MGTPTGVAGNLIWKHGDKFIIIEFLPRRPGQVKQPAYFLRAAVDDPSPTTYLYFILFQQISKNVEKR